MTVVERVTDQDGVAVLRLHAPALAAGAAPGTFVTVATPVALLRRPFWIAGAEGDALTLRVRPVGAASAWLADRRPGDDLDVLGPLGRPIDLPPPGGACVLAGPADAPLLSWLAVLLPARGVTVTTTPAGAAPAVRHALLAAALPAAAPPASAPPASASAAPGGLGIGRRGGVWAPSAGAAVVPRRPAGCWSWRRGRRPSRRGWQPSPPRPGCAASSPPSPPWPAGSGCAGPAPSRSPTARPSAPASTAPSWTPRA